jgi:hypothetical protein
MVPNAAPRDARVTAQSRAFLALMVGLPFAAPSGVALFPNSYTRATILASRPSRPWLLAAGLSSSSTRGRLRMPRHLYDTLGGLDMARPHEGTSIRR